MKISSGTPIQSHDPSKTWLTLLILYALGIGFYFVSRYGGQWIEVDTSRLTRSAQAILNESAVIPTRDAYPYGYAYPVMTAWTAQLTSLPVTRLQTNILPVVGAVTSTLVALVFFRSLLGTAAVSLLATLLLYLQADFLFVTMRGSHEKLTWPLVMLALFLLVRTSKKLGSFKIFTIHLALFYFAIYALIASNSFFASTLITAISLAFLLGIAITRFKGGFVNHPGNKRIQRLAIVSASGMILLYFFIFYIYVPAIQSLNILPTIADQVATLFLGFQPEANPYAYIELGWVSPQVYLALTLFTWLMLSGSLVEWIYQGYRLLKGARLTLPDGLPWLLYAGFAIQVAVAILLDFAGVLSSNLQLRLLPGLVVFAVVLVAQAMQRLLGSVNWQHSRLLAIAFAILVMGWSFAALLKTNNDPIVSNKWGFYSTSEKSALQWSDIHIKSATIWVGLDERLSTLHDVLAVTVADSNNNYIYEVGDTKSTVRYFLLSETERFRHARIEATLPAISLENQVYDNGEAQLYHRRPLTPYQR